jgi:hypothetical protein
METASKGLNRFMTEQDLKTPFAQILHQPSKYYRMRYEAENRRSFLFSNNNQMIFNDPSRDPESIDGLFPQIEVILVIFLLFKILNL